jgi:hypothetical protein
MTKSVELHVRLVAALFFFCLFLIHSTHGAQSYCLDAADRVETDPTLPTIVIEKNPWFTSYMMCAATQILLEEALGYPVRFVPNDLEAGGIERVADGTVMANLVCIFLLSIFEIR